MGEIWITHYSVRSWSSASEWDDYLCAVEYLLGDRLIKLDVNDPVRRKANVKSGEGKFIIQFGEKEESRWLWGRFEKTKIEINIELSKLPVDSFGRHTKNQITFYVPKQMSFDSDAGQLIKLFRLSNERLNAFYAYADFKDVLCGKKPSTPSLDISRELLGVFWLTYFGPRYCAFFGRDRLLHLRQAIQGPADGITLQLAEFPSQVPESSRITLEHEIAPESFAGTGASKNRGQFALTLAQLACEFPETGDG